MVLIMCLSKLKWFLPSWSKARWICIFSLGLYCFDTGSDIFVAEDLFDKCHVKYASSVLTFVFLPGIIYGCFEFFRDSSRELRDVLICFVFYPLFYIPISIWKLFQAVRKSGDKYTSAYEEDDAKL